MGNTLAELDVRPGDVVTHCGYGEITMLSMSKVFHGQYSFDEYVIGPYETGFTIIKRVNPKIAKIDAKIAKLIENRARLA